MVKQRTALGLSCPIALRKAKILLRSERPKLYTILVFQYAKGLNIRISDVWPSNFLQWVRSESSPQ